MLQNHVMNIFDVHKKIYIDYFYSCFYVRERDTT